MTTTGILKAAGTLELLVGIILPQTDVATAVGLILFFVGAVITHLCARDYSFGLAVELLVLEIVTLWLRLVST